MSLLAAYGAEGADSRGRHAVQHPVFALCGRTSSLEPDEALEAIGDADGADEEAHAVLLACEHVLSRRAHGGALRIGCCDVLRQRLTRRAPLVNIALEKSRARTASFFFER